MALLKRLHIYLLLTLLAAGLSSCFQDFEPDIPSTPVLCMNSEITPGDSIILYLSHSWRWSDEHDETPDVAVENAEVRLIVNGEFRECLRPGIVDNDRDPASPFYKYNKCYRADYIPRSGDVIRLEASSAQYGEASAEVTLPDPVPIDEVEVQDLECIPLGDTTGWPAVKESCVFIMSFKLLVHFTDPAGTTNYYDFKTGTSPYSNYNSEAISWSNNVIPDFNGEPLFTEHVSVLESAVAETSGYTIFSDRQINGKRYPLRIGISDFSYYYRNPLDLPGPKDYGITLTLRHIDSAYYRHVLSVWEANDAIIGALSGIGLANPVYAYSNVSPGAGVVTAYATTTVTIPMVDLINQAGVIEP